MLSSKPFWARVALLGFGLYGLVLLAYVLGSLANGEPGVLVFVLIASIPALLAAFFIVRFGSWAYVFGFVASAVGLLFFGPAAPLGFSSPDSFFDFFGSLFGIVGLIISLIACAIAFFKARAGTASMTGSPAVVMGLRGLLAVMTVLAALSAVLTLTGKDSVSAADKEGAVSVRAHKTDWTTETLETTSNGKIVAKNSDPVLHTFAVKELDIDVKLTPGSEKLIKLDNVKAGTYEYICSVVGHESMKGTLTIK